MRESIIYIFILGTSAVVKKNDGNEIIHVYDKRYMLKVFEINVLMVGGYGLWS